MIKICYLSDNPIRIKNSKSILQKMELGNGSYVDGNRFQTKTAEYVFIDCRDPEKYAGVYADQAIIDYREPIISIARKITAKSCVPDEYKIIDDRKIGASDT